MVLLLNNRPGWIVPLFRQTGFIIEYKRFPADYTWRQFIDLNYFNDADVALAEALTGVAADVATAQATAETALANAATAQATADTAQATADTALATAGGSQPSASMPDCAYLVPGNFRTISSGFLAPVSQAGQWTHSYAELQGSGGVAEAKILLAAGSYEMTIGYIKSAASGRLAVKLDGSVFPATRIDFYNATTQLSQQSNVDLGTNLAGGLHTIRLENDGKNISSSGFSTLLSFIAIRKKP